ncbi:ABC transporter permease [Longispora sp. K20-0274]|uniref:FtsX-like permease family protein n=1 Tax=Longispora sp. K20-0274 TaxID=3088255 RepID=UPI00399B7E04
MIRLGLRLAVAGGREAAVRLAIVAAAVALGVGLLLATVASVHAVNAQNARYAWLNTGTPSTRAAVAGVDPAWWLLREDYFHRKSIGRVDVAATGPAAPVPPGVTRLPGPGEFYASPALSALLRTTPASELGDRYPGHEIGVIGPEALPAPDSLVIIVGHSPEELSRTHGARQVSAIGSLDPGRCADCAVGTKSDGLKLILSVVAGGLLFPLLMFIGTATRLSAARREQRFAAMRLVGATPRQISVIAAVESAVAAVAGTAVGFGLYALLRPSLAAFTFTGAAFFPADLSITALDAVLVALGIPLAAAVAAGLALRRVRISPLGVSRRVTPRPPRAWRLIPLVLGLTELAYFIGRRPVTTDGQVRAYLTGFLLVMVGLVLAGPWLTMVGARLVVRSASRPATLIAGRRLTDNPRAGFRAVSGLMLALFVTSVATGVITSIVADRGAPRTGSVASTSLATMFWPQDRAEGEPAPPVGSVPAALGSIPGVEQVLIVRANPLDRPDVRTDPTAIGRPSEPGVIGCAELARGPAYGACPAGAAVAEVSADLIGYRRQVTASDAPWQWEASPLTADDLARLPLLAVVVNTDGSTAALESVRTALEVAYPQGYSPGTISEFEADFSRELVQWQRLADVLILASLPIAGCSLAVSVIGGLSERKRPFSMLRLTGVPLGVLRRVVALESTVPLLAVSLLATGTGFWAAHLFLSAQMHLSLRPPPAAYYLLVAAGLAVSLAIIGSTLPLLTRITGPETARNE